MTLQYQAHISSECGDLHDFGVNKMLCALLKYIHKIRFVYDAPHKLDLSAELFWYHEPFKLHA